MSDNPLRALPSVDRLLNHLSTSLLVDQYGRTLTVEALRAALDEARQQILAGKPDAPSDALLIDHARAVIEEWLAPTLRPVINATGIIIHTNLGRAPLSDAAIEAVRAAAGGYSTLEYDLASGKRGSRSLHAEVLLQRITGAEAALVVNNNASAVLLALTALAGPASDFPQGRGVIVSRGQLVEIGGGFRMPDVMAHSGARLVEVGTTNRTHLPDYEHAIAHDTGVILRVHRSNFAIVGFTTEPAIEELTVLAKQHNLISVDDVGSGALLNTADFSLAPEPMVQASLQAGVDLVMFSGDKLLGGPQAGILVGSAEVIDRLKRHPLTRALRPDKLCLAALSATLTHYLKGEVLKCIPIWRMISAPLSELEARAQRWCALLIEAGLSCEIVAGRSAVGGGSLPGEMLPTMLLAITVASADTAAAHLRTADPPVIARIESDRLLLDPRTVLDREEADLLKALETLKL
jgi:L-seryl-tRNA(Ser) seleniumtransferase